MGSEASLVFLKSIGLKEVVRLNGPEPHGNYSKKRNSVKLQSRRVNEISLKADNTKN